MKQIKYGLFGIFTIVILSLIYFITYSSIEPKAYDFMSRNFLVNKFNFDKSKNIYGHSDIIIVLIDTKTNEKYRWPWKRELNCKIYNYLKEYGKPKVIVHDSIITTLDIDNPASDAKFFNSVKSLDNLVVGTFLSPSPYKNEAEGKKYDEIFIKKFAYPVTTHTNKLPGGIYSSILPFPQPYFNAVKQTGSIIVVPGSISGDLVNSLDEVYRTQEYIIKYKNSFIPSLSMRTFLKIGRAHV